MKTFVAVSLLVLILAFAAPTPSMANAFMDVPQGYWAYDAMKLLTSRGILSGYSNDIFKGTNPVNRYEMASAVARMLSSINIEKADEQDLVLLKKLVLEFKDELDALGVKVDMLDKRSAILEERLGGWRIQGTFSFDAKFAGSDSGKHYFNSTFANGAKNEFTKNMFYLYLTKQISEDTYFFAEYRTGANSTGGDGRGDQQHSLWSYMYTDTRFPSCDIGFRFGRFLIDFEGAYGLFGDNDALFGDYRTDGFRFTKSWGDLSVTAIIGRNDGYFMEYLLGALDTGSLMNYVLDINWRPNEKFMLGATGYWFDTDSPSKEGTLLDGDYNVNVYGVYAQYKFTPSVELKGIYYFQDLGRDVPTPSLAFTGALAGETQDSPKAWKAMLDIKQDLLGFTGFWIEHAQQDNTFLGLNNRYSIGGGAGNYDFVGRNMEYADPYGTSKWWFVKAYQNWDKKWSSFIRFTNVDFNTNWLDNATEWGVGVAYQYTPAIRFELVYDNIDHGDNTGSAAWGKESVVRFRTDVNF
ncbi:S-layer homology domain-containing protein [Cloacibacillus sp.]